MTRSLFPIFLFLLVWPGCGTEVGNPKKPGSSKVADSPENATYVISSQVSETSYAISEDSTGSDLSLAQARLADDQTLLLGPTRNCSEQSGSVVVTDSGTADSIAEVKRRIGTVRQSSKGSESEKRTWSGDSSLRCNLRGDAVRFTLKTPLSLNLETEFSRERAVETTLIRSGTSTTLSSKSVKAKGARTISLSLQSVDGKYQASKTIKSDVTRTLKFTNKNSELTEFVSRIYSDTNAPLKVTITYESGAWSKRIIESGKIFSNQSGDSTVMMEYKSVEYRKGHGCMPVNGQISGNIYREGETEAADSFAVTFAEDSATIKYKSGTEDEYVAERCPLDE